jgi:hypothetical protein
VAERARWIERVLQRSHFASRAWTPSVAATPAALASGDSAASLSRRRRARASAVPASSFRTAARVALRRRRRCRSKRVIRASVCACCSTEMVELAAPSLVSIYSFMEASPPNCLLLSISSLS